MKRKTDRDFYERFTKVMMALTGIFNRKITVDIIEIYYRVLSEYTIEEMEWAASKIIKTLHYFPRPADFVEAINDKRKAESGIIGDPEKQARNQAHLLADSIAGRGYLHSDSFDNVSERLMARGSYSREVLSRTLLESDVKWFVKDFIEDYLAMKMRMDIESENQIPYFQHGELRDKRNDLKSLVSGIGKGDLREY